MKQSIRIQRAPAKRSRHGRSTRKNRGVDRTNDRARIADPVHGESSSRSGIFTAEDRSLLPNSAMKNFAGQEKKEKDSAAGGFVPALSSFMPARSHITAPAMDRRSCMSILTIHNTWSGGEHEAHRRQQHRRIWCREIDLFFVGFPFHAHDLP